MESMTKYGQTLSAIAITRSLKIREVLPPTEATALHDAIAMLRLPAYSVWAQRFNASDQADVVSVDMSTLYAVTRTLCELIGTVNGAKLHPENLVEVVVSSTMRKSKVDTSAEMAVARFQLKTARDAVEADESNEKAVNALQTARDEVRRLEKTAGHCRYEYGIVSVSAFVDDIAHKLGAIINKQKAMTAEEVRQAEEARRAAMKARKKAREKAAKEAKKPEPKKTSKRKTDKKTETPNA